MTALERMERQAVLLDRPLLRHDPELLDYLRREEMQRWGAISRRLRESGDPLMAGEGPNYHETRDPYFNSADFSSVSPITTSISLVPVLRLLATPLAFPDKYWQKPGRRWEILLQLKVTTAATPGNWTFEIRHQTGTPTDAGGTILATSAATAFTASKTNITCRLRCCIESRGEATTFVPTATPLFAYGSFTSDGTGAIVTSPGNPIMIPASAAVAVNIDATLAGTIHVDAKRSGSTAETVVVQDVQVNSMT